MKRRTPIEGAEKKGRQAFRDGVPRHENPYRDKRQHSGRLSWSRAFRNAWFMGYDLAEFESRNETKGG